MSGRSFLIAVVFVALMLMVSIPAVYPPAEEAPLPTAREEATRGGEIWNAWTGDDEAGSLVERKDWASDLPDWYGRREVIRRAASDFSWIESAIGRSTAGDSTGFASRPGYPGYPPGTDRRQSIDPTDPWSWSWMDPRSPATGHIDATAPNYGVRHYRQYGDYGYDEALYPSSDADVNDVADPGNP